MTLVLAHRRALLLALLLLALLVLAVLTSGIILHASEGRWDVMESSMVILVTWETVRAVD